MPRRPLARRRWLQLGPVSRRWLGAYWLRLGRLPSLALFNGPIYALVSIEDKFTIIAGRVRRNKDLEQRRRRDGNTVGQAAQIKRNRVDGRRKMWRCHWGRCPIIDDLLKLSALNVQLLRHSPS